VRTHRVLESVGVVLNNRCKRRNGVHSIVGVFLSNRGDTSGRFTPDGDNVRLQIRYEFVGERSDRPWIGITNGAESGQHVGPSG